MNERVLVHPLSTFSDWKEKRLFLPASALFSFTLFLFFPFLFAHSGFAAQVTLAWDPNTEVHLAGYRIYYKMSTPGAPYDGAGANEGDSPIDVPLALLTDKDYPEYRLTGLSDTKTYYFVVTAYAYYSRESAYSDEVSTNFTANTDDGDGGCLIATAAFGSEMKRHVRILSEFRDKRLLSNHFGRELVEIYHKLSPPVADYLRQHSTARTAVRYALIPVTGVAYLSLHFHPLIILAGLAVLTLALAFALRRWLRIQLRQH